MIRKLLIPAAIAGAVGLIFFARGGTAPMADNIARELPVYGFEDVDVAKLDAKQLARINEILTSDRSAAQIKGDIGVVLAELE